MSVYRIIYQAEGRQSAVIHARRFLLILLSTQLCVQLHSGGQGRQPATRLLSSVSRDSRASRATLFNLRFVFSVSAFSSVEFPGMARFRLVLVAALTTLVSASSSCSLFSAIDAVDAAGASANCSACVGATGCSFCLQTLQCGPAAELALSCRDALAAASGECPLPSADLCTDQADCGSCMAVAGCAWCASAASCMPASATFSAGCRGTVFDLPCPAIFTPRNDVVGDLTVQPDPVLGGGALRVTGERMIRVKLPSERGSETAAVGNR